MNSTTAVEEVVVSTTSYPIVYPISDTGCCPTCASNYVNYIVLISKDATNDDDIDPLLLRLLVLGLAYKLFEPDDDTVVPSFKCLACGYGFNLDFEKSNLETVFHTYLNQSVEERVVCSGTPTNYKTQSELALVAGLSYTTHTRPDFETYSVTGSFNKMTGGFQANSTEDHFLKKGIPVQKDMRQMGHFFDLSQLIEAPCQEPIKKVKISKKQVQMFKIAKKKKKEINLRK